MIRLFTAIALPGEVRERLAAMAGGVPGARWTPPENMHLTLAFIGNVEESLFADIDAALAQVRASAFDITIEGVGDFRRGKAPSMLWAGVARNDGLDHLHERVTAALARAGVQPERRKYTPHVTLARLKGSPRARVEAYIADHSLLRLPPFTVDSFALYSSFLGHAGAIYRPEAEYALAGSRASARFRGS